jgi:hypothetical protein
LAGGEKEIKKYLNSPKFGQDREKINKGKKSEINDEEGKSTS